MSSEDRRTASVGQLSRLVAWVLVGLTAAAILFPHLGEMAAARFKMLVADAHGRDIHPDFANIVTRTVLIGLIGICTTLLCVQRTLKPTGPQSESTRVAEAKFWKFAKGYLPAYLLGTFADWMLGPYVYAVYAYYGYAVQDISRLYIVGFASSLMLGTLAGPLVDKYGRKRGALAYCGIMVASCVCKNTGSFWVLIFGRILGGVGTSLLYTAFESWAVSAFDRAGLPDEQRSRLFSIATFGNAMAAIFAGLFGNELAARAGPVAPFNTAIVVLALCATYVLLHWQENYGGGHNAVSGRFKDALAGVYSDPQVFLAGFITAVYEAVLYVFVFIWTPSLESRARGTSVPLGLVFASYMVAKMCGATIFEFIEPRISPVSALRIVLATSAVSFAIPVAFGGFFLTLLGHCGFEFAVGMYWPAICTYRSLCLAEETRSTTLSLFRVPLNILVCLCLNGVGNYDDTYVYMCCSVSLGFTVIAMTILERYYSADITAAVLAPQYPRLKKKTSDYPPYDTSFILAEDARARITSSVFEDAVSPMDMVEVNSDTGGTPPSSPRDL